ncbi:MAG: Lrp/AsnC family transcriptional regulator [Chitinophagales bacterium]
MDQIDWQIVQRLQQDARTPYTTIAAELGLAEGTVRHRVARLVDEGYIRLAAVLNPLRLGKQTMAIVGVRVHGDAGPQVVELLKTWPEIRYVAFCAGEYDLIMQVVVASNDELFHFLTGKLREVQGILASDTSLILRTCKESEEWLPLPPRPAAAE